MKWPHPADPPGGFWLRAAGILESANVEGGCGRGTPAVLSPLSSQEGLTSHVNITFAPFHSVIYAIVIRTIWMKSKDHDETVISNCSGKTNACAAQLLANSGIPPLQRFSTSLPCQSGPRGTACPSKAVPGRLCLLHLASPNTGIRKRGLWAMPGSAGRVSVSSL